jgi:hypothetical protein
MERGFWRGCRGGRHSARGAEEVSAASVVKAAMPLASSPVGRTEGTAGKAGITGVLEQEGPEQGRGFPESSAGGTCPKLVCVTVGWEVFLPGERSVTWLPQEA